MGINKVDYFGKTLIDLTEDTVTADTLKKGITAHAKNGEQIVGESETKLQSKSTTPTKSAQTIKPDSGYDGLSQVAVGAIPSDYIIPSGTLAITSNGTKDVKNYASVNVNVPVPSGYIVLDKYYHELYTPSGSSLVTSKTFTCNFKPKVVLIILHTDTTVTTVNGVFVAFRSNIDNLTSAGEGLYKLSTTNRLGAFGGGIPTSSFSSSGFQYSHATIGFLPGVSYDIHIWGSSK